MKRGGRGFKGDGASFCHHCGKQLQAKAGGGFHFVLLLTPHDCYTVRTHGACVEPALADGYRKPPYAAA